MAAFDALVPERNAKERLRAGTEATAAAGVVGVPTLTVCGAEVFWGVYATPMAVPMRP